MRYSDNPVEFIVNALSPARILSVDILADDENAKEALVVVPDDQLSLAIGRDGQNVRLAHKLTNWKIDIKSETQAKLLEKNNEPQEIVEDDFSEFNDNNEEDNQNESIDDEIQEEWKRITKKKGADIVIHSLHKTLPSMTQTALLHMGEKSTKWTEYVKKYLDIFETSSPSYVFMAGMDQCMRLIEARGKELFEDYSQRLHCFKKEVAKLPHIHLLTDEDAVRQQVYETDPGKLVIAADGWNGHEVAEFLRRKEHLEVEMEAAGYVIALTSIADTDEGFKRLKNALIHIEENISTNYVEDEEKQPQKKVGSYIRSLSGTSGNEGEAEVLSIAQATACEHTTMDLERSIGEISGEYIYLYPPGIPLVVPGERITEELLCQIREVRQTGLEIQGMRDYSGKKVDVCRKV